MVNRKLVYGVGINDADYVVHKAKKISGNYINVWMCKTYSLWTNMLMRCNSDSYQSRNPTYFGCFVSDEWHSFMAFKLWVDSRPARDDHHLDKDIIYPGNKCYSKESCSIISRDLNLFIAGSEKDRDAQSRGSYFNVSSGKFQSSCRNPFTKKSEFLGSFLTEVDAHSAWKARKHSHACAFADIQSDPRVAAALRIR